MLTIKKSLALVVLGREIGARATREVQENSICSPGLEIFDDVKGLTHASRWGMVKTPNLARRNKRRSGLPKAGKSLVTYSVCHAAGVPIGRFAHIGRVTRPGFREGPAASLRPGSVLPCLFSFKTPKVSEALHV